MQAEEYRAIREALGFTAQEMADHHGVALKTQQRWENGHREIPAGVAKETAWLVGEFRKYVQVKTLPWPSTWDRPARWRRAVEFQRRWM